MRWLAFFLLAYVSLGVQIGLSAYWSIGHTSPNLVLLAAVFVAASAPRDEALLGCVILGLMQDLLTGSPLGLWAVAYGAVGLTVVRTRDTFYREYLMTHVLLGLIGGLVSGAVVVGHGWLYARFHSSSGAFRPAIWPAITSAIYTAFLAPIVLGLLHRIPGIFSFRPSRKGLVKRT